jgi:hypothetical protein
VKIWYDTEFIEDGKTIDLISIGMVREDGKSLYAISNEFDASRASPWVYDNVIMKLDTQCVWEPRHEIRRKVQHFCEVGGTKPEFWAYYGAYDHVALCQLFGRMVDLPKDWPYYTRDLKQLCDSLGNPQLPTRHDPLKPEHHALWDALWTWEAWRFLEKIRAETLPA